MVDSYSCLRLDNKHVFQVEVYEDKDRQKFFEFGNKKIPFVNLKVGQLAKFISEQEKFEVSKLWKVDVDKSKLNPGSTDDDVKELGGVSMEFEHKFERYFKADCELTDNIHIVVIIATTSTGKCLPTFYLSNKKFAVTKYRFGLISLFLIVLSYWTKTIRRFKYVFDTMLSSKHEYTTNG